MSCPFLKRTDCSKNELIDFHFDILLKIHEDLKWPASGSIFFKSPNTMQLEFTRHCSSGGRKENDMHQLPTMFLFTSLSIGDPQDYKC